MPCILSNILIFRRTGPNFSLPAYVNFTTVSIDATGSADCQSHANDYCTVNKRLTFRPQQTKLKVSVRIHNDTVAEGPEQFHIQLTQPEGCLLPRLPPQPVWITDYEDCEFIIDNTSTLTQPSLSSCVTLQMLLSVSQDLRVGQPEVSARLR